MLPREHQGATGAQPPAQLPQGSHPVIDVFDRQRAQHQIDAAIRQPADRICQVMHPELALPDPRPADLHHPGAVVEWVPDHTTG
jgi:hypothetical protein